MRLNQSNMFLLDNFCLHKDFKTSIHKLPPGSYTLKKVVVKEKKIYSTVKEVEKDKTNQSRGFFKELSRVSNGI